MMTLKMNLLGGAVALVKDTFAKNRNYKLPLAFQEDMSIDILALDSEEELMNIVECQPRWVTFWQCFSDLLDEGLIE